MDAHRRCSDRLRHGGLARCLTERSLADLVERAYIALGGTNVIHFFGVTPMTDPSIGVPTQFVANAKSKPATPS